ncbi:MAG: hypothetical protein AAF409_02905 [Pseudomonadota bacterium]
MTDQKKPEPIEDAELDGAQGAGTSVGNPGKTFTDASSPYLTKAEGKTVSPDKPRKITAPDSHV